jgi:hypothetical protein
MKAALIGTFTLLALSLAHAEVDPFTNPAPDPPRPERKIENLPSSISHKTTEDGAHSYTVTGVYDASEEEDEIATTYEALIPECTSLTLNFENRTCTFTTSRQLTFSELAYAFDDLAQLGGDLPYWLELEARDIEHSEAYHPKLYAVDKLDEEFPTGLAWFWVPRYEEFRIPFKWTPYSQGQLLIVPHTAHCMARSRFTIRILDRDGKLVWQDDGTAFGAVRLAVADTDEDGAHEIYIDRDDHHGRKDRLHLKQSSEQDAGGKRDAAPPDSLRSGTVDPALPQL